MLTIIDAHKLSEIAKMEGVHYQTVIDRKSRGVYVGVRIRSGKKQTESIRYLSFEDSKIVNAFYSKLKN